AMWPWSHSVCSCASLNFSNRNSVRSSSGTHVSPITQLFLRLGQVPVHQHHGHRPFADGGRHTLGGFGTHVPCNKHTGHTCFQMVRRAVQRPAADVFQVRTGQDETVVVLGDDVQPVGAR